MVEHMKRIATNIKKLWFNLIGRNDPYPEGSIGSYRWRAQRGKLTDEEIREMRESLEGISEAFAGLRKRMEELGAIDVPGYYRLVGGLLRELPEEMREHVMKNTPVAEALPKIDLLLRLASYSRERTANNAAFWALRVSVLAFLISTATLAVAVWTLTVAITGP